MTARFTADGTDATVGIIWAVFIVLVVVIVVVGILAWRRYNRDKHILRAEGLGPLSAAARVLGQLAGRRPGTGEPTALVDAADEPPGSAADVQARLREITELHDQGVLDDAEFERQRARMLKP
jgi:hypothetical protein